MGKLLVVFRREYLERVRSKWFLLGTLLGPVFFLLVAGAPRGGASRALSALARAVPHGRPARGARGGAGSRHAARAAKRGARLPGARQHDRVGRLAALRRA